MTTFWTSAVSENPLRKVGGGRHFKPRRDSVKEMVLGRRWLLKRHFDGLPTLEDFELVEEELPALQEDQFVFRSLFIRLALDPGLINIPPPFCSVDPYQRP